MAEQTTTLCWLAAFIWLLPKRQRFRFFAQFHPELREFFSQETAPMATETDAFSLHLPFVGDEVSIVQIGKREDMYRG